MPSLVKFRTPLSFTSHSSSATCEIRPVGTETIHRQSWRGGVLGKEAVRTEVVRDDDYTTLELLDRTCERIDGHHVQMVRRLICRQRRVAR